MKLYYSAGACSLSPHIVLAEAGLEYELVRVDLANKTLENGEDYYAINPLGCVPALALADGSTLTEGSAIVQYLADQKPEMKLAPAQGSIECYRLQQWLNFISTELHKGVGPLFNPNVPDAVKEMVVTVLGKRLDIVARQLGEHDFIMGDGFTVADAYLFTVLSWAPHLNLDLSAWPVLGDYVQRIGSRPAVLKVLQEEGLI